MPKVLIVGCGDLGTAIATRLRALHEVVGLRVSEKLLPLGMQTIQADVTKSNTLSVIETLKPNIIIYCVSAGGATDEKYEAAYVTGLKNILTTQANNQTLQHVFFVSSTRVYGQVSQDILNETTLAIPADFGGERLLEAENVLKEFCLNTRADVQVCKSTSMRLSGIYGEGRLYLANMAKDTARWPAENHWSNRIHRDDAAGFIVFLVEKVLAEEKVDDTYIVTDDMPTQQYQVLQWLATQQGVDASHVKIPPVSGGKCLSNKRLRDMGFKLQYPNYQIGYGHILKKPD